MRDEFEDNQLEEVELTCVGCEESFTWTVGEQNFMNSLFEDGKITKVTAPKRCKDCRIKKKKERAERAERGLEI